MVVFESCFEIFYNLFLNNYKLYLKNKKNYFQPIIQFNYIWDFYYKINLCGYTIKLFNKNYQLLID